MTSPGNVFLIAKNSHPETADEMWKQTTRRFRKGTPLQDKPPPSQRKYYTRLLLSGAI